MADFIAPPANTLTAVSLGNALSKNPRDPVGGRGLQEPAHLLSVIDRSICVPSIRNPILAIGKPDRAGFFSITILPLGLLPLPQGDPDAVKVKNPIASTPEIDCCRQAGLRQVRIVLRR